MWFERDMNLIEHWLLTKNVTESEMMYFEEKDTYFRTHLHFGGDRQY